MTIDYNIANYMITKVLHIPRRELKEPLETRARSSEHLHACNTNRLRRVKNQIQ